MTTLTGPDVGSRTPPAIQSSPFRQDGNMSIPTIRRVATRTPLLLLVLALQFIVTIFLSFGRVSAQTPSGLVAAYGFEEGTGNTVADLSGNGNVGTINGAAWTTSGKYGKALSSMAATRWLRSMIRPPCVLQPE